MQNNHKDLPKGDNSKFKVFSLALLLLAFSFTFYVSPVFAITEITFTTEPQTISPNTISDGITVSSDVQSEETSDLFLTSSSATGEFSSSMSNWKPVSKVTWNKTWANRTFYYRNVESGADTLAATLTGRVSGQSWTATQSITVGDSEQEPDQTSGGEDEIESDNSAAVSAHSSPTALSTTVKPPSKPLALDLGRDRLVAVGVPMAFRAKVTGGESPVSRNGNGRGARITWSFGDGGAARGPEPTHFYYFPGTYIVVATVEQSDEQAVARVAVEVVQPEAVIGEVGLTPRPYVQIINNAKRELNLGYWQIRANGQTITLPADTLIAAQKKIYLPLDPAKISITTAPAVELLYPNGQLAATKSFQITKSTPEVWRDLQNQLNKLLILVATQLKSQ